MKKILYIIGITAGVALLSSAGSYKSAGPPGCFAGEPPNNTNCTSCHTDFTVNSGGATVLFDVGGADTGYVPGATYNITVSVKKAGMGVAGFQFIALQDNDNKKSPGTVTLDDPARTQKVDPANPHVQGCGLFDKVYIEHTYQGITLTGTDENSWTFKWKAPDDHVGDISFYMAAVEADNSGDEFGDYVYTRKAVSKGKPNSVNSIDAVEGISLYPNPASAVLYINAGVYRLNTIILMNMQGAVVRQYDIKHSSRQDNHVIDLNAVTHGVYFVQLQGDDLHVVKKVVVHQ